MAWFLFLKLVTIVSIVILSSKLSEAAKIVHYPMFGGSQYMGTRRIALELASRGHEVTILTSSTHKIQTSDKIQHATYKVPYKKDFLEKEFIASLIKGGFRRMLSPTGMAEVQRVYCEALLNDTALLDPLKNYDLIITDSTMFCGPLVADYLNITRIEYCPFTPRFHLMAYYSAPIYPSYVPLFLSGNTGKMNFLQRVKNTLYYAVGHFLFYVLIVRNLEDIKSRYQIRPERSIFTSMADVELVLHLSDFAMEYPYPVLPGHKMIGPLNVETPKPLPPDLQQLMDSSGDEGAIMVSFGSNVASVFDKETIDMLAHAFSRLKEKVIWRMKGYIPPDISSNIKVVKWLPQNDLLAHEQMRAFVSHVGQNSLYESSYYGIPLVAVPLCTDQFDNAILAEHRGVGLSVNIKTVSSGELYDVIRRVIDEPRFKANAERISRLMKDRPRTPVQEAADWVEYTLRHGRLTHLRPYSIHLTWYQYFLVDVMLFLALVLVLVVIVIRLIWRCMCRLCCWRPQKTKTQ